MRRRNLSWAEQERQGRFLPLEQEMEANSLPLQVTCRSLASVWTATGSRRNAWPLGASHWPSGA